MSFRPSLYRSVMRGVLYTLELISVILGTQVVGGRKSMDAGTLHLHPLARHAHATPGL